MRVSIRVKLVLLLTLVALLPLVAALVTLVLGGRQLRTQTIGQGILSVTSSETRSMREDLTLSLRELEVALQQTWVVKELRQHQEALPPQRLAELDRAWPKMPLTQEPMRTVLSDPIADLLKQLQRADGRIAELLVTDRLGQLVAASERTEDFYQADEEWWQGVADRPKPQFFIPPIDFDPSAGVWSVSLCIPIMDEDRLVGVAKAVVNITSWLHAADAAAAKIQARALLIRQDGTILYALDHVAGRDKLEDWNPGPDKVSSPGWRVTPGGRIQAHCPLGMPAEVDGRPLEAPQPLLMMDVPAREALQGVYKLSMDLLLVGAWLISAIFVAGLLLAERSIVRRLKRISASMGRVAGGDLTTRVPADGERRRLLGHDELDDLAESFNRMIEQLDLSRKAMEESMAMKTDFLRVASHELRTPVSYMLGMYKLMRDSQDPTRLMYALQSMGAKAHRLDEIIQAMFKLLPEPSARQQLRYENIPLGELLEEAYLDCFPFAERRRQDLVVESAGAMPVVTADRQKLLDALENLVMNAIKFSPDGKVIRLVVEQPSSEQVSISVIDQGPGIPPEEMPRLFEPFYSGPKVMQHSTGTSEFQKRGIGLGLAIVRHFIELHGGKVAVTSGESGATFTITIPLQPRRES